MQRITAIKKLTLSRLCRNGRFYSLRLTKEVVYFDGRRCNFSKTLKEDEELAVEILINDFLKLCSSDFYKKRNH